MAFHPLRTFQKNRKFWMASILLVCMVTFVLCTGLQGGDFGDWLMRLIGGNKGELLVSIDGKAYYRSDLDDVKVRRDIANEFMRKATDLAISRLQMRIDEPAQVTNELERQRYLMELKQIQFILADRLTRPRYFSPEGTKIDDLVEFLMWKHQADKLGIRLTTSAISDLISADVFGHRNLANFNDEFSLIVQREVQRNFYQAGSFQRIVEALGDEFRVRMAQLALAKYRTARLNLKVKRFQMVYETRFPPTPAQMNAFYNLKRAEAEIAVIPIRVENFLKDIPAPTVAEEEALFRKYRDKQNDPTSPEPGFKRPNEVKIQWVSADPDSKFYKDAARTVTTLQITPPFLYDPLQPLAVSAAGYAARSAAWDASLARNYDNLKRTDFQTYLVPPFNDPYFALPLFPFDDKHKPTAVDAASLFGSAVPGGFGLPGYPMVAGYQTLAYKGEKGKREAEMAPVLEAERKRRITPGATVVLLGAAQPPAAAAAVYAVMASEVHFQPLVGPLKEKLRSEVEARLAQRWVNQNMIAVRRALERRKGKDAQFVVQAALAQLVPRYGLSIGQTKAFYSEHDIASAPELEPLKKAYEKWYELVNTIEGLGGTSRMLKEDDFNRLFFGGEEFSVGNADVYTAKPWPPVVVPKANPLDVLKKDMGNVGQRLWETAERPFLFWKTEAERGRDVKNLAEVEKQVEHAWKVRKARENIVPHIKKVAEALLAAQKAPDGDLRGTVRAQARAVKEEPIFLQHVAPLVPTQLKEQGAPIHFEPYQLPRGKFTYPREDMAEHLLALRDLKAPIQVGDKAIDELNRTLFEQRGKGRVIQVLPNRPKTAFYVVVQLNEPRADREGFLEAYTLAPAAVENTRRSLFVDTTQEELAGEFRHELLAQMRRNLEVEVTDAARKIDNESNK